MIIEASINIRSDKYTTVSQTKLEIDSDTVDLDALRDLIAGLLRSAVDRAERKLNPRPENVGDIAIPKMSPPLPPPVSFDQIKEEAF